MEPILPEVLIAYLFHKNKNIKIDTFKFHHKFYTLKENTAYKAILNKIKFSGSPANPYSEILDEALFNLQFSGALCRQNPDLISYSTSDSFEKLFKFFEKNILNEQKILLDQISAEVRDCLC